MTSQTRARVLYGWMLAVTLVAAAVTLVLISLPDHTCRYVGLGTGPAGVECTPSQRARVEQALRATP